MTKEEYISVQTESYQKKYKTLFKRVTEYEKKNGTDLGEFTSGQLEELLGISRPLSPEDSKVLRLFNIYKEKIK